MKTKKKPERAMDRRAILKTIEGLKEGDTFSYDGDKHHILVNLKKEEQIVFKYYGKHKQYWHYDVESYFWFEIRMRVESNGFNMGGRKPLKFKIKK